MTASVVVTSVSISAVTATVRMPSRRCTMEKFWRSRMSTTSLERHALAGGRRQVEACRDRRTGCILLAHDADRDLFVAAREAGRDGAFEGIADLVADGLAGEAQGGAARRQLRRRTPACRRAGRRRCALTPGKPVRACLTSSAAASSGSRSGRAAGARRRRARAVRRDVPTDRDALDTGDRAAMALRQASMIVLVRIVTRSSLGVSCTSISARLSPWMRPAWPTS